jgi:hypothetical protein
MFLHYEDYEKQAEFIEEVSQDPMWLLTCLTCTDKNINPCGNLTFALWVYAGTLGCHAQTEQPPRLTEKMIQWLLDMQEAGAPVLMKDIPENCFRFNGRPLVISEWERYYVWLQVGHYEFNYLYLGGCDLPALKEKRDNHIKSRCRMVTHAVA